MTSTKQDGAAEREAFAAWWQANCRWMNNEGLTPVAMALQSWEASAARSPSLLSEVSALRKALEDARTYIEATTLNAASPKTRANYAGCLQRIDDALNGATP